MGLMLALLSVNCFAEQGPAAKACLADLESIPGFLLENDTGAPDHLKQFGQKYFDDAFAAAKAEASQIRGNASCAPVISKYLRTWRHGHLRVEDIAVPATVVPPPQATTAPTIEIVSAKTLRLTLKSFGPENRDALISLIQTHREDLAAHPNWIIDVRGNGGGSDSTYAPWLMADEMANAGTEILVTPANIEGWTRACPLLAPGNKQCPEDLAGGIASMRKAASGTYVFDDDGGAISYSRIGGLERHRPSRVAVLIDGGCGSSCEQFALEVRQSFSVKLIGQHTNGSLDYANLRPHELPSGRRILLYATTRSSRIPGLMVDVAGVQPDIYLPVEQGDHAASEEVLRVQAWLEGGTLAPPKH